MTITFDSFDKLERKPLAERLTKAISAFYPFTKEAYVLSLDARFGSGKTTFLKMWKSDLEASGYAVIYIDAWESDFDDEPLIPIISTLLGSIQSNTSANNVKAALQGALGATAHIANATLHKIIGIDVKETITAVKEDLEEAHLVSEGEKIYREFSYKQKVYARLKKSLSEYTESLEKKPLIILVDELDRVRPDYAVKFLEAIKHIFSVQGICFVLAVDREQLKKSIQQLYGDIDFNGYYRRFVTREVKLPEASRVKTMRDFIDVLSKEYFEEMKNNGTALSLKGKENDTVLSYMEIACSVFSLSPREIELLFRIYRQFMAVEAKSSGYMTTWLTAPVILIVMLIKNEEMYKALGNGTASPREILDYIDSMYFLEGRIEDEKFSIVLEAIAFSLTGENTAYQKEAETELQKRYGNVIGDVSMQGLCRLVNGRGGGFPRSKSIFQQFYEKIEDWRDFLDDR